jgi:signal transduction histidine kinase
MQSAEQIILVIELSVYAVLLFRVLFRRQVAQVDGYLIAYLVLSLLPTLLWLVHLTFPTLSLPPEQTISSWARLVPVLAFGGLTMAFLRQPRWALAWLVAGVALFGLLVALQLGWLNPALVAPQVVLTVLWALALAGATLAVLLSYRRQTSPLHRNRYHYWLVILGLLTASQAMWLFGDFVALVASRVLGWLAAGMATYVILEIHPPELRTLLRQTLRFLALTAVLALVLFGILIAVQRAHWPALTERDSLVLTAVLAVAMAVFLPGLTSLAGSLLNRFIFGSDYDEQEVVRHYSQGVSNILDMDRLAAAAFDVINQVFGINRGALLLVEYTGGGTSTLLPVRALGQVSTQSIEIEAFGSLMNRFRQGSPLTQYDIDVLPAYRRIPDDLRQWLTDLAMELYVPIRSQDEVIGVLALGAKRSGEAFSRADLNLLSTLAGQTVAALKNAQMVQDMRRLNLDISRLNVELESMNRTKSDFISITSHELRTPLSQVNGYCQILSEELGPTSDLAAFVDGLLKGASRLTEIVDMMLDVSSLEGGEMALNRSSVHISQVIHYAVQEWQAAIEERGHTLVVEDLESLPPLEGDGNRLQQAFSQLINNAIKYTPDGGRIEINGQIYAEQDSQFLEVTVKDSGIGVNPEDQHRIFDNFYRTGDLMKHSTGKVKFKGAGPGLGLSLVRGIVGAHSGRVWVESPGHDEETCPGSVFHVLLPLQAPQYNPLMAQTVIHRGSIPDVGNGS